MQLQTEYIMLYTKKMETNPKTCQKHFLYYRETGFDTHRPRGFNLRRVELIILYY